MKFFPLFAALLLLAGCGSSEKESTPAQQATPAPTTQAAPAKAAFVGDAERGKASYNIYCFTCHGMTGAGDGPAAAVLDPKPAAHNDPALMSQRTDEELFHVVKSGGAAVGKSPMMAPWGGTLSDQQIWDLVAYMRQLSGT